MRGNEAFILIPLYWIHTLGTRMLLICLNEVSNAHIPFLKIHSNKISKCVIPLWKTVFYFFSECISNENINVPSVFQFLKWMAQIFLDVARVMDQSVNIQQMHFKLTTSKVSTLNNKLLVTISFPRQKRINIKEDSFVTPTNFNKLICNVWLKVIS